MVINRISERVYVSTLPSRQHVARNVLDIVAEAYDILSLVSFCNVKNLISAGKMKHLRHVG
jgi:hypothetical protein